MIDIDALVKKAQDALAAPDFLDQAVMTKAGDLVTVRIQAVSGEAWRNLTAAHPPRDEVKADRSRGYNLTAVAKAYPAVSVVDGEDVQELGESWKALFDTLAAPSVEHVEAAVWGKNEYEPASRLGKALMGESVKKHSSPESSE